MDFDWYYGPEAGGFVLSFPRHAGKELRTVDLGYLEFCAKSTRNEPFKAALPRYLEGLNAFIDDTTARPGLKYHYTYLQVRVPFGKKYFGARYMAVLFGAPLNSLL
uniref:Uncharacterized protein n=1 Tax=Mycena chlorophos TaxID=658473 RepID=A0ABQ0M5I4_MYCCL|nr:predicted protein [Mycena chlorophos]